MVEHTTGLGDQAILAAPKSKWRNALMAGGFFCFLIALFVGAAMKEAAGRAPMYLALLAIALILVSAIASLINWISLKGSRGAQQ